MKTAVGLRMPELTNFMWNKLAVSFKVKSWHADWSDEVSRPNSPSVSFISKKTSQVSVAAGHLIFPIKAFTILVTVRHCNSKTNGRIELYSLSQNKTLPRKKWMNIKIIESRIFPYRPLNLFFFQDPWLLKIDAFGFVQKMRLKRGLTSQGSRLKALQFATCLFLNWINRVRDRKKSIFPS